MDPDNIGRPIVYDGDKIRNRRYDVWSTLGRGTFGTVVAAYDSKRKHDVALKIIRDVERYRRAAYVECRILDQLMDCLGHRNSCIVEFFGNFSSTIRNQRHVCISFECLGRSVYSFLKANAYRGFNIEGIRNIMFQVFHAVAFCHSIGLTHTDLKLENILFVDDSYKKITDPKHGVDYRVPILYAVKLIDFGNATYETDYHSRIINTRQYRAPEVILGLGWNHQSDIWSLGCIICELWTGSLLFQTHENIEHLALIEKIIGKQINQNMISKVRNQLRSGTQPRKKKRKSHLQTRSKRSPSEQSVEYFLDINELRIRWPEQATSQESIEHFDNTKNLKEQLKIPELLDLTYKCLEPDPSLRYSAKDALKHPFISDFELRSQWLRKGVDVLSEKYKSKLQV